MGSEARSPHWHAAAVQALLLTCVMLNQRPLPHPPSASKNGGLVLLKSVAYPPITDLQRVKWELNTFRSHELWVAGSWTGAVQELVVAHNTLALDVRHYFCNANRSSRTWLRKTDENRDVLVHLGGIKRTFFDATGREVAEGLKHTGFRQFHHCGKGAVCDHVGFMNITFQGHPGPVQSKLHLWRVLEEIGALGHYDRGVFASNIQAYQVTDGELLPLALPQRTEAAPLCHPHGPTELPVSSRQLGSNSAVAPSETRGSIDDLAEKNVSVSTSTRSSFNESLASVFCGSDNPLWSRGSHCVSLLDHTNDMLSPQGENWLPGGFSLWEMMETDLADAEGMIKSEYDDDVTGRKTTEIEDNPTWCDNSERDTTRPDNFIAGDVSLMYCEEQENDLISQERSEQESHIDGTASPCCSNGAPTGQLLYMYCDTETLEPSFSSEMQAGGTSGREECDMIDFVDCDGCDECPVSHGADSSPLDSDTTASLSDADSWQSGLVSVNTSAADADLSEEVKPDQSN